MFFYKLLITNLVGLLDLRGLTVIIYACLLTIQLHYNLELNLPL
jgi:hypothetical protein